MAMSQRDVLIDEIVKTDALLKYAVMHGEVEEAERLRAKLLLIIPWWFWLMLGLVVAIKLLASVTPKA